MKTAKAWFRWVVFFLAVVCSTALTLSAQETYTGEVVNENGQGLIAANIMIKGSGSGTQTDFEGYFTIEAKPGDILVVSYIGYQPREVELDATTHLTIELKDNPSVLD